MPWIVGIDEAGYGPNLGPFIMTSVACRVPEELAGTCLWQVLQAAVRRPGHPDDGRFLVEDSKQIYSTTRGLLDLETGVLATVLPCQVEEPVLLSQFIEQLCPASRADLANEPWYSGTSPLPVQVERAVHRQAGRQFQQVCQDQRVLLGSVRSVVYCPSLFNQVLDRWGSKGAVLSEALVELLESHWTLGEKNEPVCFFIDKHGGRNNYAPMLQHALPDGMVIAQQESMQRSTYRVLGLQRDIQLTFQPRADAEHFCVALASMVSKYLRELLMLEFNRFWRAQVPDLKPTAGYPGDAARFYRKIRPAARRLGIAKEVLWRRK